MSFSTSILPLTAAHMFQIAAIINIVSIAGHTKYGYDYFYRGLDVIPEKKEYKLAKYGSAGVWNYANCTFFIAGALNYQWSFTNGPTTLAENLILLSLIGMGAVGGLKFLKIGNYQPLIPLWYASFFTVVAWVMIGGGSPGSWRIYAPSEL